MDTEFESIKISGWQQFKNIDIEFDKRITIITGANGSGKSTLLNILGRHFNWSVRNLGVPKKDKISGEDSWSTGSVDDETAYHNNIAVDIGELVYSNGERAKLTRPVRVGEAQYDISINGSHSMLGIVVPSHRSVFSYQKVENLPMNSQQFSKSQASEATAQFDRNRIYGNSSGINKGATYHIKEVLLGWNIFGYGNPTMSPNEELLANFRGFEEVLKKLLPKTLGFRKLLVDNNEIILSCRGNNNFMIDGASGGLTAVIDLAWKLFMYSEGKEKKFTVLIDEVENHLHPSMQRRILTDLLNAFPQCHFIVTTHSPLIVSSVKDASVYALRYDVQGKVHSVSLDLHHNARTATEILDEVLDTPTTMPLWAEAELERIVKKYTSRHHEAKSLNIEALNDELTEAGLESFAPSAFEDVVDEYND